MSSGGVPDAFSTLSTDPVYNVKAACVRTGITAATLRAWERRYGVPHPNRSDQGYRLYSERDVAILMWLKQQTDSGINIAHAVAQLNVLLENGQLPPLRDTLSLRQDGSGLRSPAVLRAEIVQTLLALEERAFEQLMSEALAIYTIETALITILQQAVHEVRQRKREGKISTTTEHLAVSFAHQRLLHMAQTLPNVRGSYKSVVTVGFAAEHNDFDLMIMNVLLRRHGIPVTMLGTDLDPQMLEEAVAHLDAGAIVFYADEPRNVIRLVGLHALMNAEGQPVRVICCGAALAEAPELKSHIDCEYLGPDLRIAIQSIQDYIQNQISRD